MAMASVSEDMPPRGGRDSETLRAQLQAANLSLENLREEMQELQADNKRLGGQVRTAKAEAKKASEGKRGSNSVEMVRTIQLGFLLRC